MSFMLSGRPALASLGADESGSEEPPMTAVAVLVNEDSLVLGLAGDETADVTVDPESGGWVWPGMVEVFVAGTDAADRADWVAVAKEDGSKERAKRRHNRAVAGIDRRRNMKEERSSNVRREEKGVTRLQITIYMFNQQ